MEEREKLWQKMDTKSLNANRFILQSIAQDVKLVDKNLKLLVNQNTLDLTPTLLSGTDTGAQERQHAASTIIEALHRIRHLIDTLP